MADNKKTSAYPTLVKALDSVVSQGHKELCSSAEAESQSSASLSRPLHQPKSAPGGNKETKRSDTCENMLSFRIKADHRFCSKLKVRQVLRRKFCLSHCHAHIGEKKEVTTVNRP